MRDQAAARIPTPLPEPPRRGARRGRTTFLAISALAALATLVWAREVLFPFVLALVVAYVLMPAVLRVERRGIPRWVAILGVYAVTLGTMYGFVAMTAPRLVGEMAGLAKEGPALVKQIAEQNVPTIRGWVSRVAGAPPPTAGETPDPALGPPLPPAMVPPPPALHVRQGEGGAWEIELGKGIEFHEVADGRWKIEQPTPHDTRAFDPARWVSDATSRGTAWVQENTLEVLRVGRSIVAAVTRSIFVFFITLMLAAYIMMTRERILDFFRGLVPRESRYSFDLLVARLDKGLSGVVRGQLLICVVNGVLSAIGFAIFGLKYWPVLAFVAGVMSLVPIFGSILSSVPVVAIALTQSFGTAVAVLLWIVGIHQLEANFLNPKIIGDSAKIHPVLVVFSLLVGEHFFALPGALLAVPVLSITQSFFLHFQQVTFGEDAPPDSLAPRRNGSA
jgi:predicted PurR-regulated permease PerM